MKPLSITRVLGVAALALATSGVPLAPAVSAQNVESRTTGVTYSDLDLTTQEGVAELDRRIDRAAKQVCGMNDVQVGTRARTREARQCYRDAKRKLERQFARIVNDAQRGG